MNAMPDGNTAALRQYEEEQDRLEALAPSDAEVKAKQEEMYWDRLHDLDAIGDALLISEMGETQIATLELIGQQVALQDTAEAGRLLGELLYSRLYPSPEDAEYELRHGE